VSQVLALPSQILFALLGMLGLAHYARQIVRVRPRVAGTVALKASEAGVAAESGAGKIVDVDAWITQNTPSLSGSYTPSWWLPK
jgi:hypothetical protein